MKKMQGLGLIALAALLFAGCVLPAAPKTTDDSSLNGTWGYVYTSNQWSGDGDGNGESVEVKVKVTVKLNNGAFESLADNVPQSKGTYTTSGGLITTKTTHVYSDWAVVNGVFLHIEAKWYSEAEFKTAMLEYMTEEEYNDSYGQIFSGSEAAYNVRGNKLTIGTITYTRET